MVKLIALCDGHGMQTIGKRTPFISEIGRFVHENEFNRAVVNYLDIELKRCGFNTLLVAPTDQDTSLQARVNLANSKKADAYVSIHYDALDAKFDGEGKDPEGHTIFVWTGQRNKASGKLAECVLKYLNQGTPQQNRGIKEANFQVLRDSNMIAILSENGFMDNKKEALWMVNPDFQKEVAIEHAKGICEYFGVAYKDENPTPVQQPIQTPPVTQPDDVVPDKFGMFPNVIMKVKALVPTDIRKAPSHKAGYVRDAQVGEVFDVYGIEIDWHCVGGTNWIDGNGGRNLYWIDNPTLQQPVQQPTPQPKKSYVVLPASASSWTVYKLGRPPVKSNPANIAGTLKPSKFGGLEYEVLKDNGNGVYEIQTSSFGRVQIYAAPSTSATVVLK